MRFKSVSTYVYSIQHHKRRINAFLIISLVFLKEVGRKLTFISTPYSNLERTPTIECWMLHSLKKQPCDIIESMTCMTKTEYDSRTKSSSSTLSVHSKAVPGTSPFLLVVEIEERWRSVFADHRSETWGASVSANVDRKLLHCLVGEICEWHFWNVKYLICECQVCIEEGLNCSNVFPVSVEQISLLPNEQWKFWRMSNRTSSPSSLLT